MSIPDPLTLYGETFSSRLLLGTAQYPSPAILRQAVEAGGSQILTVSLRRETAGEAGRGDAFWRLLQETGARLLPNTAGCHTVREAVSTAQMAREVFGTPWIKLEVIGEESSLCPDPFGLVEAAGILCAEGFQVFPYMTADLVLAGRLLDAGCEVLMPWASPIGSGRGIADPYALGSLRSHFPGTPLIVDAGIGKTSDAVEAMELGYDAILLNTAVAKAGDPVLMAKAFGAAIAAGRSCYLAEPMEMRDLAAPSTPTFGQPFVDVFRD